MRSPVFDDLDLAQILDERSRAWIVRLLNLVEEVTAALRASHEENQRLRDEINRLKGEQGKPTIKGNKPPPGRGTKYSSEQERRTPKEWTKEKKVPTLRVDREQVVRGGSAVPPAASSPARQRARQAAEGSTPCSAKPDSQSGISSRPCPANGCSRTPAPR